MQDLTHTNKKITVLRGFSDGNYLVAQGDSFRAGLNYKTFKKHVDAIVYFHSIIK